jgi:asparagine synthetase B (glutamine-hydrolysing)
LRKVLCGCEHAAQLVHHVSTLLGVEVQQDLGVGFGHRRLSIIDLSPTGAQPMASGDGNLVIAYNGEIYNYAHSSRL